MFLVFLGHWGKGQLGTPRSVHLHSGGGGGEVRETAMIAQSPTVALQVK